MARTALWISLVLLLGPISAWCQTNVGGTLTTNTIWSSSGSPYIVQDDIIISQGVQLLIDAGVEVRFKKGRSIIVHGLLRAVGTSDKIISLKPDTSNPNDFWWAGIYFSSTATPYNFNTQQGCLLKYCRISYAGQPNLFVDPSGQTAFTAYALVSLGVLNCTIEYSACGINASGGSQVTHNKFLFNTADLFTGHLIRLGQNSAIAYNLFYQNAVATADGMLNIAKNIKIFNNLFIANGFVDFYPSFIFEDSSLFYSNTFIDNALLTLDVQGAIVHHNTFARNQTGLHFVKLNTCSPAFWGNNIGENASLIPGSTPTVWASEGTDTALLTMNFWNENDSAAIAGRITDYSDDIDLCLVQFTPFSLTPDTLAPLFPPNKVRKGINWLNGNTYVTWEHNTEADLKGYNVYFYNFSGYSFSSKVTAGLINYIELPGVSPLTDIAVTAFDHGADGSNDQYEGHESWFTLAEADSTVGAASDPSPQLTIFPNPTSGWVTLSGAFAAPTWVEVYNMAGQQIAGLQLNNTSRLHLPHNGIFYACFFCPMGIPSCHKIVVIDHPKNP
ncbi:MAG: T9SS type A sorting domain-containing protein [Chitinophagales bacterium]|nr:T9SS type A sorting domain-containing protein [Chitinophagales bacterium]MDW8427854.1 hypothetical protein [Chitinophagales bacterium]